MPGARDNRTQSAVLSPNFENLWATAENLAVLVRKVHANRKAAPLTNAHNKGQVVELGLFREANPSFESRSTPLLQLSAFSGQAGSDGSTAPLQTYTSG